MAIDLEIKAGDILKLPTGLYRFCEERPNNVLLLQREGTALDLPMPEWKLKKMLGDGTAEKIDFVKTDDPAQRGPNDNADFGPGEDYVEDGRGVAVPTPELQRAKALQFYARKWDQCGRGLGGVGLLNLIRTWRPVAVQQGLESKAGEPGFFVKPAQLRHAIKNCGTPGNRPLRLFRSRRGKACRKRFCDFVENELDAAVYFYWNQRERTYNDAYASFRSVIDAANDLREQKGLEPFKLPERPETLRRRIVKATNYINWAKKYSKHEAHQKFKGVGDSLYAEAPLDLVIMDHTKIDTWTVLDTDTFLPLGRPHLTVAIDVCTRMILGYLVTFEPPSLYSVLTCLKRVNKNKAYVAKVFPDIKHTWDAWGRPRQLLVDHAWEFTSPSFQDAMHDLGTDIIWAPVRAPQYKAIGERFFGTLNMKLFHRVKGGVPYDPRRMRLARLNPRAEAVITLNDLDELMHQLIIDGYHRDPHEGLNDDVPARLWREKLMFHKRPWIRDIKALNALLGRTTTATLTTSGIRFSNLRFHEMHVVDVLLRELVRYEAKRSQSPYVHGAARVRVKIKWNPFDASSIDVWDHASGRYATLQNRDRAFISHQDREGKFVKKLSFWHAERVREFALQEGLAFQSDRERWEARDALRRKWEKLAGLMPMRESGEARRGLAQSMDTFDDTDVNEDEAIAPEDVLHGEVPPSTEGFAETALAPDCIAGAERTDHRPPPGRKPRNKTTRKSRRREGQDDGKAAASDLADASRTSGGSNSAHGGSVQPQALSGFDEDYR